MTRKGKKRNECESSGPDHWEMKRRARNFVMFVTRLWIKCEKCDELALEDSWMWMCELLALDPTPERLSFSSDYETHTGTPRLRVPIAERTKMIIEFQDNWSSP